ncbi:hypothetical protein LCGC14_2388940, partial [marine sediment metagenome]
EACRAIVNMSQAWMDGTHPYMGDALTAARYKDIANAAIAKAERIEL